MTIEYQKTWEVMNGLEEAFNNIATIEFLVKELNYAIQADETTLIEGAARALKEYLPVYISNYEKASKRAWNNTVVKVAESDVPYRYNTETLTEDDDEVKYDYSDIETSL
tara:strand:+ start:57 stop:386 length:330 start_codon:yes stop_codon:yes gene_type:complete